MKPENSSVVVARSWQTKYATAKPKDLIGKRFGRLLVISRSLLIVEGGKKRQSHWLCRCDCGVEKFISTWPLYSGRTVSCGCYGREKRLEAVTKPRKHGKTNTRAHKAWMEMNRRCRDPKRKAYPDYGGRGIKICERWSDFRNFFEDMGECPDGLTLERKDTNGNYEPSNCRWATHIEQNNNRRSNRWIEWNGKKQTSAQWSRETGISQSVISMRIVRLKWPEWKALTHPVRCFKDCKLNMATDSGQPCPPT